jgi:hypothetical protein
MSITNLHARLERGPHDGSDFLQLLEHGTARVAVVVDGAVYEGYRVYSINNFGQPVTNLKFRAAKPRADVKAPPPRAA